MPDSKKSLIQELIEDTKTVQEEFRKIPKAFREDMKSSEFLAKMRDTKAAIADNLRRSFIGKAAGKIRNLLGVPAKSVR